MSRFAIYLVFLFTLPVAFAQLVENNSDDKISHFSGRISRINSAAQLVRIKTDFGNIKFLRRKDRVEFWNESFPDRRCAAFIEGVSNMYMLLRVPEYNGCIRRVHFTTGTYLHFDSADLDQTVVVAKELVEILLKKRFIMEAKKRRNQIEMDKHFEKVNATNQRFEILRQKLEIEWKNELAALEEDKSKAYTEFKESEARLHEIDSKLEAYRIEDNNLKLDRWALDPSLYIKK